VLYEKLGIHKQPESAKNNQLCQDTPGAESCCLASLEPHLDFELEKPKVETGKV